jgi:hypothetical protein
VIQAPKPELRIIHYELYDYEWTAIKPMLPSDLGPETGRMVSTHILEPGQPLATFVEQHVE